MSFVLRCGCVLLVFLMIRLPPRATLTATRCPYTTLFRSRLAVILGHAGNREDADLRAVATTAAGFGPELVVLKDIGGYERGRGSGDVARIMREALGEAGIGDDAIETRLDEVEAARHPPE